MKPKVLRKVNYQKKNQILHLCVKRERKIPARNIDDILVL